MAISALDKFDQLSATVGNMEDAVPKFCGLLYGPNGTGKTVLALKIAQAIKAKNKKIMYVDFAKGFATLVADDKWHYLLPNVRRMQYQGISQLQTLAEAILRGHEKYSDIDVIILDEDTSMTQQDLMRITKKRAEKDSTKDPDQPTQPDMGVATNRWADVSNTLNALPVHIIRIAHIRVDKNDLNREITSPSYMPKLAERIARDSHLVAYMSNELVERDDGTTYLRNIQVHPTKRVVAKSRVPNLDVVTTHEKVIEEIVKFCEGVTKLEPAKELILDIEESGFTEDTDNENGED